MEACFQRSVKPKSPPMADFLVLSAGSLLQGSNPKKLKTPSNQTFTKEVKNSIRFTEDLIKIHEFYKIFIREITAILEKG